MCPAYTTYAQRAPTNATRVRGAPRQRNRQPIVCYMLTKMSQHILTQAAFTYFTRTIKNSPRQQREAPHAPQDTHEEQQ